MEDWRNAGAERSGDEKRVGVKRRGGARKEEKEREYKLRAM